MSNMKSALYDLEEELEFLRYVYEHIDFEVTNNLKQDYVDLGNVVPEGY